MQKEYFKPEVEVLIFDTDNIVASDSLCRVRDLQYEYEYVAATGHCKDGAEILTTDDDY